MKKRLLITSVVMMLVVAVALGTSTYAWFTSNATVTTSPMTLKAEVNGASSLGIGWLNGEANTAIETNNVSGSLFPMAPATLTKNTTTSDVLFRSATIKEEASQYVFNNDVKLSSTYTAISTLDIDEYDGVYFTKSGENKLAKAGVKYYATASSISPIASGITAGETNVGSYYIRPIAPIVYNNGTENAFYVKNLSTTNSIGTITVSAEFTDTVAYVLTADTSYKLGKSYYFGDDHVEKVAVASVTDSDSQVLAEGNTDIGSAYEYHDGTDMIRVAIFTKPASSGTSGETNYTLLGVLGKTKSTPTMIATDGADTFNKNTTYYVRSGAGTELSPYTYEQTAIADASAFATAKALGTLCTIANTAAFTSDASLIELDDAVKDLGHYTNVATSLTLADSLAPLKEIDIVAIAWMDGTELTDARAGDLGQVSLKFTA